MPITRFPAAQAQLGVSHLGTWEEANIPPNVTLRALTTNAAELLGVDKDRGAIRPGLAADLIATPGNPLDDVAEQRDLGV